MNANARKDLIVIVADKSMQAALQGILQRPQALGIRSLSFRVVSLANHDCGVRTDGVATAMSFRAEYSSALLLLDYEGCGADGDSQNAQSQEAMQQRLRCDLRSAWGDESDAVVIDPELDAWAWGSDESLRQVLGWHDASTLREWVVQQRFVLHANGKPVRPKEALEAVCRRIRIPRSAALYGELAGRLSLQRCEDAAFLRLRSILRNWFPKV